jgi:hypothetical protein
MNRTETGRQPNAAVRRSDKAFKRGIAVLILVGAFCVALEYAATDDVLKKLLQPQAAHIAHIVLGVMGGFGEAAMIAGILAGTVDLYLKRRLTSEILEDVSAYVMSHALPPELQSEVDRLCRQFAIRENLTLSYSFSEIKDIAGKVNDEFILMTLFVHFEVVNLTDQPQPFVHSAGVQQSPTDQSTDVLIPEVGAKHVYDKNGHPADYVTANAGEPSADGYITFLKEVWLRPKDTGPSAFFWSYRRVVLPKQFQDTFILTMAAVRPRLEVYCPDWMDVRTKFSHPTQPDAVTAGTPKVWVLPGALPPYASISIEWRKKGETPPVVPIDSSESVVTVVEMAPAPAGPPSVSA